MSFLINPFITQTTRFPYWRFSYIGTLSELTANWDGTMKLLTPANGVTLTAVSGVALQAPSLAAISDGLFGQSNTVYIGHYNPPGTTTSVIQCVFNTGVYISSIGVSAQGRLSGIYNVPPSLTLSASTDGNTFTNQWTATFGTAGDHFNPFPNTTLRSSTLTIYTAPL